MTTATPIVVFTGGVRPVGFNVADRAWFKCLMERATPDAVLSEVVQISVKRASQPGQKRRRRPRPGASRARWCRHIRRTGSTS